MAKTTHGQSRSKLYKTWIGMKDRCYSKSYKGRHNYGERGIDVCEEWQLSFETFQKWALANGYKEGLTIDRKDNDGDYCPSNCQFITRAANNGKKRTCYTIKCPDGVERNLLQVAEIVGVTHATLSRRIKQNPDIKYDDLVKPAIEYCQVKSNKPKPNNE
jgi:hypothetical protein